MKPLAVISIIFSAGFLKFFILRYSSNKKLFKSFRPFVGALKFNLFSEMIAKMLYFSEKGIDDLFVNEICY